MRIRSEGAVPRVDLSALHRLVPSMWAEWAALRFGPDGLLLDPDTGAALGLLRLTDGAHRSAGARYCVAGEDPAQHSFTLGEDDGRTVRGELFGPSGRAHLSIGHPVSVSGKGTVAAQAPYSTLAPLAGAQWTADVTVGDRWRVDGRAALVGPNWSGDLTLGAQWHAVARIDVRALLMANDVPGYAIGLIGAREATVDLQIDPSVMDGRGDLVSGRVRLQRVQADGVLDVRKKSDAWHCRITLRVRGRGVLGRIALLVARRAVRRAVRDGFGEFWTDLVSQATSLQHTLADLDREATRSGGRSERLHRELWKGLREAARPTPVAAATPPSPPPQALAADDPAVPAGRPRRRRHALPVVVSTVVVGAFIVVASVIAVVAKSSSGGSSPDPDPTTSLQIRQVTVAAFAGTDLQAAVATSVLAGMNRVLPDSATDDLTGRDTATVWESATKATAPDGTAYTVFLVAAVPKSDPRHPSAAPTFIDAQPVGAAAGLGAGWRSTTELGPLSGPPWYPSATIITGNTLLIIRLDVTPGAAAELRRLTVQLSPPIRQRYLATTRP